MSVDLVDPKGAHLVGTGLDVETVLDVRVESVGWARSDAMIDEWGRQSFPASDPPSNW
jgi:hypothetical protein